MADTFLLAPSDFVSYHGGSGVYRAQAVTDAMKLAEGDVRNWIGCGVVPTTETEEIPWPTDDGKVMLRKVRLISIQSVTALHSLDCSCEWQEATDCAVILNARQSIIQMVDCNGVGNRCWPCRCPRRARVTYTHGFTAAESAADTMDGIALRSAIMVDAVGILQANIGLGMSGSANIGSFSSAGYSESRNFNERSGANERINPLIQEAKEIARRLMIRRNPLFRKRSM